MSNGPIIPRRDPSKECPLMKGYIPPSPFTGQPATFDSPPSMPPATAGQNDKSTQEDWGVDLSTTSEKPKDASIIISNDLKLPLEISYQVMTITGKRGSGKSFSVGKIIEEFHKNGIQFVIFDPMDAHGLIQLPNVVHIEPTHERKINMEKFIQKLKETNKSVIVNMSKLKLEPQRKVVAEYSEMLIENNMGRKPLMTFFEECQDFIPQTMSSKVRSLYPIIRLTKLGRQRGYGVCFVTQRPASASKECLTQSSLYIVHNILNTVDLNALKDLLSFGTDKQMIRDMLTDVTKFEPGYFLAYSPDFIEVNQGVVISKTAERETEHKGRNVEIRPGGEQSDPWSHNEGFEDTTSGGEMSDAMAAGDNGGFMEEGIGPENIQVPIEPGLEPGSDISPMPGVEGEKGTDLPGLPEGEKKDNLLDNDYAKDALGIGLGVLAGVLFFVIAKKVLERPSE